MAVPLAAAPLVGVLAIAARWLIRYIVVKAMTVLGLGFVSFIGVDALFDYIESEIAGQLAGMPGDIYQLVAMCGFIDYVSILTGAFVGVVTIKGMMAGARMLLRFHPLT